MNETALTYPYTIDRASVYMHTTPELSGEMCDELPYGTRFAFSIHVTIENTK